MRFLAAPWGALLDSGAWLRNAEHANACARYFSSQVSQCKYVAVLSPIEANSVFLSASVSLITDLRHKGWHFYTCIGGAARFMFSRDSTIRQIDLLVRDIAEYGSLAE
jgi:threonine aldolase